MSFFGGPRKPPTHRAIPLQRLMTLSGAIGEAAPEGTLTLEAVGELAEDEGVPRSHLLAAMLLDPSVRLERESSSCFVVCAGNCQQWGSLDLLEQLLRERDHRSADGRRSFDVVVRGCLDRCDFAPVCAVETEDGIAALPEATAEKIAESVAALLAE